ncbi:nucleotidyltransferase family protein [Rhodobacter ferrooxidans]|uniref:MobA-like NTP transferase domain-containing protein n=1 Tax=Rhodobacter ferrooxidans TaxID=371731 RepID=C8RY15_9RHOB|nr:nucleotidyltransferase family protein [Rhodobacter sp. SW2]EEW26413.1 conserved hypothetical protein [Rhodobacter sp. SW2]
MPAILILAAGASARMRGRDKLLEQVAGVPQLGRIARAALETGCRVLVALPPEAGARVAVLAGLAVTLVTVADAATGMAASIRAGVSAAGDAAGLMILPADMPDLDAADLGALLGAFLAAPQLIHRGTSRDIPGHPVIFPRAFFPSLASLTGDSGARAVLATHPDRVQGVPLPGRHAIIDLDTPEDWAAWRAT